MGGAFSPPIVVFVSMHFDFHADAIGAANRMTWHHRDH
jgi:hypothetical protein